MIVGDLRRCGSSTASFEFRFDGAVEGDDGPVGSLSGLLLEPHTWRVMGLVIRAGLFGTRELRVPLEAILSATEAEIRVGLTSEEAWNGRQREGNSFWMHSLWKRFGSADDNPSAKLAASPLLLSHALRVEALDGPAGHVRRVLVDATSREIREIIVESGLFNRQSRRLPGAWIRCVTGAALEVEATLAALALLPLFRGDQEIRAAILDAWFNDDLIRPMFLRAPLDAKVRHGVATLEGYVWSRGGRQRLEARARSVPGVLEVRVAVVSDDELVYTVASALAGDSRTKALQPRIQSALGVISLEGRAPDSATCGAATEVAAAVPHVRAVINRLQHDGAGSPPLPARLLYPRVGQRVFTQEGRLGRIARILLSGRDLLVAGIMVCGHLPVPAGGEEARSRQDGPLRKRCVAVPAEWISFASGEVMLRVGHAEAADLPDFNADDYSPPPAGWIPPYPYDQGDILWVRPSPELLVGNAARSGNSIPGEREAIGPVIRTNSGDPGNRYEVAESHHGAPQERENDRLAA